MRASNIPRADIIAMIFVGGVERPTLATPIPPGRLPAPSGNAPRTEKRESASPAEKPAGTWIEYRNAQYGFCFSLPESWRGYSIVVDRWQGHDNGPRGAVTVQQGPLIRIRHPQWTRANPRQDIPIMVFTQEQWGAVLKEEFFVGAGPIGRSELTHNRRYAFALPTGYNFAFPTGYEEVEEILSRHPLHTGCPAGGHHD